MTDPEYMDRAESALAAIEAACDRINDATDADIDNQRVGGMVTLVFRNGSQLIVNTQKPLHELWLAARSGGYHFRFGGEQWIDTKTGAEFFELLSNEATAQAGQPIRFAAPQAS
jgi:CyaY protein